MCSGPTAVLRRDQPLSRDPALSLPHPITTAIMDIIMDIIIRLDLVLALSLALALALALSLALALVLALSLALSLVLVLALALSLAHHRLAKNMNAWLDMTELLGPANKRLKAHMIH